MRRLFWLALGATAGVLIVRKLSKAAEKLTPQGIAQNFAAGLNELAYALRDFAADVREAMTAQETALRQAAGLDGGPTAELGVASHRAEDPRAEDPRAEDHRTEEPRTEDHRAESH